MSVSSNIAEGHSRDSLKEYLRFISISYGSLAEVETQLLFADSLGYVQDKQNLQLLIKEISEIGRMLNGLRNSLKIKLVA